MNNKMRILYLDLNNSGISGDMFLASLLGLIPNPNEILEELTELRNYLPGVSKLNIELMEIQRSGIKTNQLRIEIIEKKDHRSAKTLQNSLNAYLKDKKFSNSAKNYATNVLNTLIHAESEVHGELAEKIHLHELSSVDTLIDILGVTVILDSINGFDDEFHIYFYTSLKAHKYKLIKKNKQIALLVPEPNAKHPEKMEQLILKGSIDILGFFKAIMLLPLYIRAFLLIRRKYSAYWRIYRKNSKYLPRAWQVKPFLDDRS